MSKEKIQSLINRVIGKEGILRVPSYWVRKLFNQVLDYTDESVAKSAETTEANAITSATATSKEYTDQQIAELGITGKEPIVYVLPERIWDKVTDFKEYRFSYTLTEAEANEFWAAMDKGIDNILFVIGRYGSIITPRNVAQVMKVTDDWYLLLGDDFLNGVGGIWYTWRPGVNLEFNASTREVEVEVVTTKTNIDIQGSGTEIAVDNKLSSTSENPVQNKVIYAELIERFEGIDELLDAINGEEI